MGTVKDLIKFRGWKQLVELKLEDNPFIETLSDYQGYRIVEPRYFDFLIRIENVAYLEHNFEVLPG